VCWSEGVFSAIGPLQQALDYHLERHNVLSSNVAHVDTPGYRPVDLERTEFSTLYGVTLERTSENHLVGGTTAAPQTGRVFEDLSAGAGNDGNFVSLDREAAKVAANQLRYDVISSVVSAELRQLRFAANDGKG
jgi:flagellar basal-body rod protein FlgB